MLELDKKVFGNITTKEIIGAMPPALPDTQDNLEKEFASLSLELRSLSKDNLKRLLEEQEIAADHINSRPGAMALAQNKIKLFNEYNEKYIRSLRRELQS